MNSRFQIRSRNVNGELHVSLSGSFDGSSAWGLIDLLRRKYGGEKRVLIDTDRLRDTCPFGRATLECNLSRAGLPPERLFFKGRRAHQVAPRGSTVVAPPEEDHQRRCSGRGEQN